MVKGLNEDILAEKGLNMKKKIKNMIYNRYYLTYTILFLIIGVIAFYPFWWNGRSFIFFSTQHGNTDGLVQHYNALMYLGKYGREIIRNLFQNHTLNVPLWDFSIGYGSDIISTLHYYVFGDPLNLLSILVPSRYTEYLYGFLVIFRLYLSGVTFSHYCFYMKKSKSATMLGVFSYIFSGYALYAFARHPFFITPMIYLPLLLIGAEKIMKKQKSTMLSFVVFLMTISNFYFSYISLVLLVLYVGIRFFTKKHVHVIREGVGYCVKFAIPILIGLMMSSIIFVPVVKLLFSGERMYSKTNIPLLYSWYDYENTLSKFVTSGSSNWACLGFVPIALIALVFIFVNKNKYLELKIGIIILTIMLLFPVFGSILNGMSYVINRWTFAYAFLVAYILVSSWDDLIYMGRREQICITLVMVGYFVVLLLINVGTNENAMAIMVTVGVTLLFFSLIDQTIKEYRQIVAIIMLVITVAAIGINVKYSFDMDEGKYIEYFLNRGKARETIYQTGDYAVKETVGNQTKIERIDQPNEITNSAWQNRTFGINYFCSMENGSISKFLSEMGNEVFYTQLYRNLDSRTMLNEIVAVKYYTDRSENPTVPYGYKMINCIPVERIGQRFDYKVYENQYALPLGYTYEKVIEREEYEKFNPIEKQQALLQGVVVNENMAGYKEVKPKFTEEYPEYTVKCSKNVVKKGDKFIALEDNAQIELFFDGLANCETYVYLPKLEINEKTNKDFYFGENSIYSKKEWEKLSKLTQNLYNYNDKYHKEGGEYFIDFSSGDSSTAIRYLSPYSAWYHGQQEFVANIGYHEEALNKITITLRKKGEYNLENMQVVCQPMKEYEKYVECLSSDILENEKLGINKVCGDISVDTDKVLYMSIPFCEGWTAYVDGEKTELFQGNTMGIAIKLKAGEHKIVLKYFTPGLKVGIVLSGIGFILFVVSLVYEKQRDKRDAIRNRE